MKRRWSYAVLVQSEFVQSFSYTMPKPFNNLNLINIPKVIKQSKAPDRQNIIFV